MEKQKCTPPPPPNHWFLCLYCSFPFPLPSPGWPRIAERQCMLWDFFPSKVHIYICVRIKLVLFFYTYVTLPAKSLWFSQDLLVVVEKRGREGCGSICHCQPAFVGMLLVFVCLLLQQCVPVDHFVSGFFSLFWPLTYFVRVNTNVLKNTIKD